MKSFLCMLIGSGLLCMGVLGSIDTNTISRIPDDIIKTFSIFSTELKCGATSRMRKVTLRNPAKQKTDCTYTIKPVSPKVCQVRIDFDMVLAQPTASAGTDSIPQCIDDKMIVNDMEFCGSNMNQHIYVPFNVEKFTETLKISFQTKDRLTSPNLGAVIWSATVTQIECPEKSFFAQYDKRLAPVGCLQYFPDPNGTIESFNYNQGNGPYLGNFDYAICVRRSMATEKLTLRAVSFELSQAAPSADGFDADCVPHVPTEGGNEDHLSIIEAVRTNSNTMRASKFCGKSLKDSTLTVSAPGPFVIQFHSDGHYDPAASTEKGFRFSYSVA